MQFYSVPLKSSDHVNFAGYLIVMTKKGIFYIVFFVVLVSLFYIVVRRWIRANDTISVVQPFSFTNQDGKQVTDKDVAGKVYVVEYFFTTCGGICPRMNTNMKRV